MADIFDFYVYDDRSIQYALAEPIMLEDKDVTQFRFRIPKSLNGFDMSDWEWWFIFVNPKGTKYTTLLELTDDEDEPDEYSVATYTVGYGFSGIVGTVRFSIEALNVSGEDIVNEWHTRTYNTHVIDTLQGTRAVIPEPGGQAGTGLTQAEKNLILTLFSKATYAQNDAGTAYDALEAMWTTTTRTITYNLSHVSSSNTTAIIENGQSYTTTLTASTNYTLNTVTVLMGGVDITSTAYSSGTVSIPSVTGNIVITATAVLAAQSITATYTQSGTVYDTDSLDSLKADLVVTANYAGGTSETVPASDYTLSGTLAEGTSTITVEYAGLTDTFDVTVSRPDTSLYNWDFTQSLTDSKSGNLATLNGNASRDGSGIHLTSSAPDFVTFGTNIYGADRTYELDITSLSMSQTNNFARILMLKNGTYNNCGFLFCGQATRGYSIYNGNGWSWISSTDTDLTKIQGKTLKIYIDSSKYWHVYIDGTLIIESTAVVNGAAGTDTSNNAITLGSSATNSLDYNMVITGLRVYEGYV